MMQNTERLRCSELRMAPTTQSRTCDPSMSPLMRFWRLWPLTVFVTAASTTVAFGYDVAFSCVVMLLTTGGDSVTIVLIDVVALLKRGITPAMASLTLPMS